MYLESYYNKRGSFYSTNNNNINNSNYNSNTNTNGKYPEKAYKRNSFDVQRNRIDSFTTTGRQYNNKFY